MENGSFWDFLTELSPILLFSVTMIAVPEAIDVQLRTHETSFSIWGLPATEFKGLFLVAGVVLVSLTFLPFTLSEDRQLKRGFYYAMWAIAVAFALVGLYLILVLLPR